MFVRVLCVVVLIALAVSGCAPNRMYAGPPRPRDEIAVVEGDSTRSVVEIDGQELAPFRSETYELEPGRHRLAIMYEAMDGFLQMVKTVEPCDVDYVFKAAHRYTIEVGRSGPKMWIYLLDTATRQEIPCRPRRPAYYE